MIRQSQNYFAAAVSAAILNAAAVAAFVFFTVLSSGQGFPLQGLLGLGDAIAPSASPASSDVAPASATDAVRRDGGVAISRPGDPNAGRAANGATQGAAPGSGPNSSVPGDTPGGGAPGTGGVGSGPTGGGGSGGTPATPSSPSAPEPPPAVQQVGGAVSGLPPAVNESVNNAVAAADDRLGGALSQTGVSQTFQGTSNSLLGPGSALGQTANSVGGALQGSRGRVVEGSPSVGDSASEALQGTPLGN